MLADKLTAVAERLGAEQVCLGIHAGNSPPQIWRYRACQAGPHEDRYPVLCAIKLFTATLVALLSSLHGFALTTRVGDLASRFDAMLPAGCGELTLVQLLAHCHGLAGNALAQPVGAQTQHAAADKLLPPGRLFAPGRFYSYGAVGYVLLGKLMEAVGQAPFGTLLDTFLLAPLAAGAGQRRRGLDAASVICPPVGREHEELSVICPAAGSGLALSIEELLSFCALFTDPGRCMPALTPALVAALLQPRMAMPGWTPYLRASCCGFRDFGNGWFGHNGVDGRHLCYLRINPATKSAVCLFARGNTANIGALPALLLQDVYPELVVPSARQPRVLPDKVPGAGHSLPGCYSDGCKVYRCLPDAGRLKLQVFDRPAAGEPGCVAHECFLYPAEQELYFLARPWQKTTCIQWLAGDAHARGYLWDQDQVLPALSDTLHAWPIASDVSGP